MKLILFESSDVHVFGRVHEVTWQSKLIRPNLRRRRLMRLQKCVLLLNLVEFLHVTSSHLSHSLDFWDVIVDWVSSVDFVLLAGLYDKIFVLDIYSFLHEGWFQIRFVIWVYILVQVAIEMLWFTHSCSLPLAWDYPLELNLFTVVMRLTVNRLVCDRIIWELHTSWRRVNLIFILRSVVTLFSVRPLGLFELPL